MSRFLMRHTRALTLLSTIVVGGLLAPTSHLIYMYVGDSYAPEMQHSGHSAATHDAVVADGTFSTDIHSPVDDPYHCPYLVLFATSLIADLGEEDEDSTQSGPVEVTRLVVEDPFTSVSFTSNGVRGPPQVDTST
jgi:hypothetical protein